MKLLCFVASTVLATVSGAAQTPNIMHAQEIEVQHHPTPEEIRDRLNYPQFQKDAKDLEVLVTVLAVSSYANECVTPSDRSPEVSRFNLSP
jgi:hypothetical protein